MANSKRYNLTDVERNQLVVKGNDLIQKARFSLSLEEQKIILYLISKIGPDDSFLRTHTFSIADFYRVCGIVAINMLPSGAEYKFIKDTLQGLRDRSWWVKDGERSERAIAWFSSIRINHDSGLVDIDFDKYMEPYLLHLREHYTMYQLRNVLCLHSKYSVRLYEVLKSYSFMEQPIWQTLSKLRDLLDASAVTYDSFGRFKERVLAPAVKELNAYTDLDVSYSLSKTGRKVDRIFFSIAVKNNVSMNAMHKNQQKRFEPKYDPNQFHMW